MRPHNNVSLIFIKRTGIPVALRGLLVFTDSAAELKRASHDSIAERFKLGSRYATSVVNHQGSALIIHKVVYSIVYNLRFADCLLGKKIDDAIFSAS